MTDAGGRNVDEASASAAAGSNLRVTDAVAGNSGSGKTLELRFSDFAGGEQAAAAAFEAMLADVDVIIDETYYEGVPADDNMERFLTAFGIASDSTIPAISGEKVFRLDGTISETNGLDWFESRLAHPHWVLQDLARAFGRDVQSSRFLRNIAAGESPHTVQASACTTDLPICGDVASPADIPVLVAITDADSAALHLAPVALVIQTILCLLVQTIF